MPMAQKGKKILSLPIFVGPSITTCDAKRQSSPNSTSALITQYGPILQDAGTFARGSIIAVECTLPEKEGLGDGFMGWVAEGTCQNHDSAFSSLLPDPRPRALSTNWHETMASATRVSPT